MSASALEAVRDVLAADASIIAQVSSRIYPLAMPQGAAQPSIVLTVVSEVPAVSFDGTAALRAHEARLQVDCYATTYIRAHQVADVVNTILGGLVGVDLSAVALNLGTDMYDDETSLYRVSMDFAVWR